MLDFIVYADCHNKQSTLLFVDMGKALDFFLKYLSVMD